MTKAQFAIVILIAALAIIIFGGDKLRCEYKRTTDQQFASDYFRYGKQAMCP